MPDINEYYAILEIKPGTPPEEIKLAYRNLVKAWHPDRFVDDPLQKQQAEEKIKKINEAYEYLKSYRPRGSPTASQTAASAAKTQWDKVEAQAELYYHRGVERAKQERYSEALEDFSLAIFLKPDYADAYRYRGLVYSMLGRERKANADLRRVAELKRKWGKTSNYSRYAAPPRNPYVATQSTAPWTCVGTLRGHSDIVTSIAMSPDGRTFATSSYDETVRLWQLSTGQQLRVFNGHGDQVYCVAISPDNRMIASGGADRNIKLWNLDTGQQIRTLGGWFMGHTDSVLSVAFHPDSKRLASGGADQTVRLWKLTTGKEIKTISGYSSAVTSVNISPNGRTLVTAGLEKAIKLRYMGSGRLIRSLRDRYKILAVAFAPNGATFASAGSDHLIRLWELKTSRVLKLFRGHTDQVCSLAFTADGKMLISGSWDNTIKVWQVATGREICTLNDHENRVLAVAVCPEGRKLVSCSADKTIKIWWPTQD
ncbi:DnaJ domain-containing protein [Spirulina sp. CS-785/01]|uniref:DnaJ domain-containing protein n=1 Tax=Spirulina sp. CS-785/01 TaxID=3021716 RepID=UPI00232ED6D8|nr:DnaJ domain-containing protein [Spirulina sp. CS-785/01]MDB9312890.1 DnaJ domain-containing protein [Spirulina sp. CS-785/01]